ncbi:MAG: DUF971 domain-containing protein [Fidelibacterota bacterium]
MKNELKIEQFEVVNDNLLVRLSDGSEGLITLKNLRDRCPCASCEGEQDVFGNIYKGKPRLKTEASYQLVKLQPVGYYGLSPRWRDGHGNGIFTAELLKSLLK